MMNRTWGYAAKRPPTPNKTNLPLGLAPGATITVFRAGTTAPVTLYADGAGVTPLANPFVADVNAYFECYCTAQRIDLQFSGTGIQTPYTLGDVLALPQVPLLARANFPVSSATDAGTLVYRTDGVKGLYVDTGTAWASTFGAVADVTLYGATGDGATDDYAAIAAAYAAVKAAGGGTVWFPAPAVAYRITQTIVIDSSHVRFDGAPATLLLDPTAPYVPGVNDRAFWVFGAVSNLVNVSTVLNIGTASMTVADVGTVAAGDWLFIQEKDAGPNEIVLIDWVQVYSVVGAVITFMQPMRMAFPGTHGPVQYTHVTRLVEDVTIRNFKVRTSTDATVLVGVGVGVAKDVLIDHVDSGPLYGNAFYTYRAKGVTIRDCHQSRSHIQGTEFASTVDFILAQTLFENQGVPSTGTSCSMDFGTAFFAVTGCLFKDAYSYGIVISCLHDGVFSGNVIDYVDSAGDAVGVAGWGCQRVEFSSNVLTGGRGTFPAGLSFINSAPVGLLVPIASVDNVLVHNRISGFYTPYTLPAPADYYFNPVAGGFASPNFMQFGELSTPASLLHLRSSFDADLQIHQEKTGTDVWYTGPDHTTGSKWGVGYNSDAAPHVLTLDSTGSGAIKTSWQIGGGDPITKVLKAERAGVTAADYSVNPIPANGTAYFEITCAGAGVADPVFVTPDSLTLGLVITTYVDAPNTILVAVSNVTVTPIAPNTATFRAVVLKFNF